MRAMKALTKNHEKTMRTLSHCKMRRMMMGVVKTKTKEVNSWTDS